ncbi:MAG TPA: glycosyltransferase family 2 protein [Acidimicrobiales bacterium]|nr:glycosyltransferase family 2 protein [Acidimicrobiales bacterium]
MNQRERRRRRQVNELVDDVAIEEFTVAHGKPQLPPVAIVIAAYKELENIGAVVSTMPGTLCGLKTGVIVVIDGEEDGSAEIIRDHQDYAVIAPVNRGQGAALRLGYRVAREYGAQYIITADADGQTDPNDLEGVLRPLVDNAADFVNGSRRLGRTESRGTIRNIGVVLFAAIITMLTGTQVTDTANPIRAMRADFSSQLTLDEPQFQASELLISAIMSGARYQERPITMKARFKGSSKKGGNFAYGANYAKVVFRTWIRERASRA